MRILSIQRCIQSPYLLYNQANGLWLLSFRYTRSETLYMIQTKIVIYNKNKQTKFEEQINEVLEDIQSELDEVTQMYYVIQDIKVINEHKVLIIYR